MPVSWFCVRVWSLFCQINRQGQDLHQGKWLLFSPFLIESTQQKHISGHRNSWIPIFPKFFLKIRRNQHKTFTTGNFVFFSSEKGIFLISSHFFLFSYVFAVVSTFIRFSSKKKRRNPTNQRTKKAFSIMPFIFSLWHWKVKMDWYYCWFLLFSDHFAFCCYFYSSFNTGHPHHNDQSDIEYDHDDDDDGHGECSLRCGVSTCLDGIGVWNLVDFFSFLSFICRKRDTWVHFTMMRCMKEKISPKDSSFRPNMEKLYKVAIPPSFLSTLLFLLILISQPGIQEALVNMLNTATKKCAFCQKRKSKPNVLFTTYHIKWTI